MSWLKKLIFVDAEETNSAPVRHKKESLKEPIEQKVQETNITNSNAVNTISLDNSEIDPSAIIGNVDQDHLTKLYEAIEAQTMEGIDYVKFKKSVNSLREIHVDENIRFTTAFVTLKATDLSLTKESLCRTIDHYVGLMEGERQEGLKELEKLRKQNVDQKERDIAKAIKEVEEMKSRIAKLSTFITETNDEIVGKKNEYALKQANFNATIDKIVKQLNSDKTKIETIIK